MPAAQPLSNICSVDNRTDYTFFCLSSSISFPLPFHILHRQPFFAFLPYIGSRDLFLLTQTTFLCLSFSHRLSWPFPSLTNNLSLPFLISSFVTFPRNTNGVSLFFTLIQTPFLCLPSYMGCLSLSFPSAPNLMEKEIPLDDIGQMQVVRRCPRLIQHLSHTIVRHIHYTIHTRGCYHQDPSFLFNLHLGSGKNLACFSRCS